MNPLEGIEINKKENIIINIKAREIKKRNINNEINEVFGENGTETKHKQMGVRR